MSQHVLYKIENIEFQKLYIGKSQEVGLRWETHIHELNSYKHHNKALQADWNKYGQDAFEFEILEVCSESKLGFRELEAIEEERFFRGEDAVYNYPSMKDKINYPICKWAQSKGYRFRVDLKVPGCKNKEMLNWNIVIHNPANDMSCWVTLSDDRYELKYQDIRAAFMETNDKFKMISFRYNSETNIEQAVKTITKEVQNWLYS